MDYKIEILGRKDSYISQIVCEIRDREIQQDRRRFRSNLEKLGNILAYEISKSLKYEEVTVTTPLGMSPGKVLKSQPVIISILRAGIPLHNGFLNMLDLADNGFISAYRHHTKGNDFIIKLEYLASPDLSDRDIILIDPMIATGRSIILCYNALKDLGIPRNIFIAGVIASDEGLENVQRHIPDAQIYIAEVDMELTAKAYIVPGLGDAGDLAFGPKS